MIIKEIALANGDFYENIHFDGNIQEAIKNSEFIKIQLGTKGIFINPEFIVSFVV